MSDFKITGPGKYKTRAGEIVEITGGREGDGLCWRWQGLRQSGANDSWADDGYWGYDGRDLADIVERIDVQEDLATTIRDMAKAEKAGRVPIPGSSEQFPVFVTPEWAKLFAPEGAGDSFQMFGLWVRVLDFTGVAK